MKSYFRSPIVMLALALVYLSSAHAQWITITASHIQNSTGSGGLLAVGQLCAQPVDTNNHPLAVSAGGGGMILSTPACTAVTAGAISAFQLPDTSLTTPQNACFRITVKDANGIPQLPPLGYNCVQPSSVDGVGTTAHAWCTTSGTTTCNLDSYPPSSPAQAIQTVGATGATGPTGATGAAGPTGPAGGAANINSGTVGHIGQYNGINTIGDMNQYAQNSALLPSTAGKLRIPSATLSPTGWTSTIVLGSSFAVGFGTSSCSLSSSPCFAKRVESYTGTASSSTTVAVSASQWCDVANQFWANETRGASTTVLEFMDGQAGYNDWQFGGGVGQQETVANLCAQFALAFGTIPSTNKITPSPATSWAADTTVYGNANNTALVSTTINAPQVFSYTIANSVVPQMVGISYRLIDTVSSTQNLGSFKVVDSYDGSTYFANTFTFPKAGTHNNPTLGGTAVLWLSVPARTVSGTYTATVTPTSPTLSTNVVAVGPLLIMPPAGSANPLWVTGMIQAQNAWNQANILTYNNDLVNNIALLQSYGDTGINFVEEQNAIFSTAAEMSAISADALLHIGDTASAAYAAAIEGPTAQPQKVVGTPDPSIFPIVRNLAMAATGDFVQCSDQVVTYSNASVQGNIVLPWCGVPAVTTVKEITFHNGTAGVSLPFTAGPGVTLGGTLAGGVQLSPGRSKTVYIIFASAGNVQWFSEGDENDPSVDTVSNVTAGTYPLKCTDQTVYFQNSAVVTMPTGCPVLPSSKHWKLKETGSGQVTFSGATGDLSTLTLYHNQGVEFNQYTAGLMSILDFYDALLKPSFAGVGTATFAAGAGAGTTPGTPACATSHVCDSLGGIVSLTTGTTPPTTGVVLTVTTGITRTNQPDCEVKMWLAASPFTTVDTNPTTSTTAIGFNLTGTALAASTAYLLRYGPCHGN